MSPSLPIRATDFRTLSMGVITFGSPACPSLEKFSLPGAPLLVPPRHQPQQQQEEAEGELGIISLLSPALTLILIASLD